MRRRACPSSRRGRGREGALCAVVSTFKLTDRAIQIAFAIASQSWEVGVSLTLARWLAFSHSCLWSCPFIIS